MAASGERAALRAAEGFGLSGGGGGLVGAHACTLGAVGSESRGALLAALTATTSAHALSEASGDTEGGACTARALVGGVTSAHGRARRRRGARGSCASYARVPAGARALAAQRAGGGSAGCWRGQGLSHGVQREREQGLGS